MSAVAHLLEPDAVHMFTDSAMTDAECRLAVSTTKIVIAPHARGLLTWRGYHFIGAALPGFVWDMAGCEGIVEHLPARLQGLLRSMPSEATKGAHPEYAGVEVTLVGFTADEQPMAWLLSDRKLGKYPPWQFFPVDWTDHFHGGDVVPWRDFQTPRSWGREALGYMREAAPNVGGEQHHTTLTRAGSVMFEVMGRWPDKVGSPSCRAAAACAAY